MKLLVPSGKTIQYKINKLLKSMDNAVYVEGEQYGKENMTIMKQEVKKSIISLVKRSVLVKE